MADVLSISDDEFELDSLRGPVNSFAQNLNADKGSSESSDTNSPVAKKKTARTTRNIRQRLTKSNNQQPITGKSCVYTNRVHQCFSAFQQKAASVIKANLSSDDEDQTFPLPRRSRQRSGKENSPGDRHGGSLRDTGYISPDSTINLVDHSTSRSPSPPICPPTPPPAINLPQKRKKQKKDLKDALRSLHQVGVLANISRIQNAVSDDILSDISSPVTQKAIMVKVRSRTGIHRFCMHQNEPFNRVINEMAAVEGVPPSKCIIFVRDTSINPYDTPVKHNITVADIVTFTVQQDDDEEDTAAGYLEDEEEGAIKVLMQSNKSRSKISVSLQKNEPLHKAMIKYSVEKEIALDKLTFMFDGEKIEQTNTPEDLDMDDGDCIDVIHY